MISMEKRYGTGLYDPTSSGLANGALDLSVVVVTVVVVTSKLAKSAALICNI